MNLGLAAKYPFSSFAREALNKVSDVRGEDLEQAIDYAIILLSARERIPSSSEMQEISLYALSRVLLACIGNNFFARRFGEEQAKHAVKKLAFEQEQEFQLVAKDLLPSMQQEANGETSYSINVLDYLAFGDSLAYAELSQGRIYLTKAELLLLLRKAIAVKASDFAGISVKSVPQLIKEASLELEKRLPKQVVARIEFKGRFLNQECVKKILAGVPEGKRYYGCMALSIACFKDRLPREEALRVLSEYAANCGRTTHAYTMREASATLDWVYRRSRMGFSCKRMIEQGLISDFCGNCIIKRRGA